MKNRTKNLAFAGITAGLYIVLTLISNAFGLASGVVQVRLSEALTVLPFFTAAAIPGLSVGCFLANVLTGCNILDIMFGTLATALGAIGTHYLAKATKKKGTFLCTLPPVCSNMIIIPLVLKYAYGFPNRFLTLMLFVGIGEVVSCCLLGLILLYALKKNDSLQNGL